MSYKESKNDKLLDELNKKIDKLSERVDKIVSAMDKINYDHINKLIAYTIYEYERKLKDENKADKIVNTFLQGRFQTCAVCGKFKFIEGLIKGHAICESCQSKYTSKGISIEEARKKARKK